MPKTPGMTAREIRRTFSGAGRRKITTHHTKPQETWDRLAQISSFDIQYTPDPRGHESAREVTRCLARLNIAMAKVAEERADYLQSCHDYAHLGFWRIESDAYARIRKLYHRCRELIRLWQRQLNRVMHELEEAIRTMRSVKAGKLLTDRQIEAI